jgi:hypothetical protein
MVLHQVREKVNQSSPAGSAGRLRQAPGAKRYTVQSVRPVLGRGEPAGASGYKFADL